MDFQTAAVIAIELAAVLFLVKKLFVGRRPKARPDDAPDVAVSALLRKNR